MRNITLLLMALAVVIPAAKAEETKYLYGWGEGAGVLELDIEGRSISGRLVLKLGKALLVTGEVVSDRKRILKFQGHEKQVFERDEYQVRRERWDSADGNETFWKPVGDEISQDGYVLADLDCSARSRELEIYTKDGTARSQLQRQLSAVPGLDRVEAYSADGTPMPLPLAILEMYDKGELQAGRERNQSSLVVEPGSEVFIFKNLRKVQSIEYLEFLQYGCSFQEAATLVMDRHSLFDGKKFAKDRFVTLATNGLLAFLSERPEQSPRGENVKGPWVKFLQVEPYTASVKFRVIAPSDVVTGSPGGWDRFFVTFAPVSQIVDGASEISVLVFVDGWQTVFVEADLAGRSPPDEYFSASLDPNTSEEALVAERIASSFSAGGKAKFCTTVEAGAATPLVETEADFWKNLRYPWTSSCEDGR